MRERAVDVGDGVTLPLLVADVIPRGFRHGFTTRAGGVSTGSFATLNLGHKWGDARENVLENRRRVRAAAEVDRLHLASQVHGAAVVHVAADEAIEATAQREADAVCVRTPGVGVAVLVADCVPALVADERTRACAAVHAGWRGTIAGVLPAAIAALASAHGALPDEVRVALGPCIGPCCFEVGAEVAAEFVRVFPDAPATGIVLERPGRRPHVDLPAANRALLVAAGVRPEHIESAEACTLCDPAGRFFSYRRDATRAGQQMGFITPARWG